MQTHTMDTGKTNHGQKLYGRSMRHKEVELCSVGGLAFYLAMRFNLTKEFEEFDLDDFLENEKWFDIKLLTDATRSDHDHTKAMANDSYAKAIKSVLGKLGLVSNHWVHLGRTIGPKLLEFLEIEAQEIRILGNWEAKVQECSYSAKLPMKAVRAANGFVQANGMHFNPRTVVEGPEFERLKRLTPFAWAYEAVEFFEERFARLGVDEGHYTAFHFVKFMANLNTVFLQDATAMLIKFPERCHCAMYNMPVFQHADFEVSSIFCICFTFIIFFADPSLLLLPQTYAATMRQSMSHEESPLDHSLESVLPGLHSRLSAMQINMAEGFRLSNHEMKEQEKRGIQREEQRELREVKRLATIFRNAADGMMTGNEREHKGAVDGGADDEQLRTDSSQQEQEAASMPSEDDLFNKAKRFQLAPRHLSLESLYFEWLGIEYFKDKPIVGGLQKCEELFKSKWRKGRSHGERKHFSRLKRIMEGIATKATTDGIDLDEVVRSMSEIYDKECKQSIAKMEAYMVHEGMIPKGKARATST
jgi:hypothetical protein